MCYSFIMAVVFAIFIVVSLRTVTISFNVDLKCFIPVWWTSSMQPGLAPNHNEAVDPNIIHKVTRLHILSDIWEAGCMLGTYYQHRDLAGLYTMQVFIYYFWKMSITWMIYICLLNEDIQIHQSSVVCSVWMWHLTYRYSSQNYQENTLTHGPLGFQIGNFQIHIKDRYREHILWNCPQVNATKSR